MKQIIPTQFLQINLANSDEIKNWAERFVKTNTQDTPPSGDTPKRRSQIDGSSNYDEPMPLGDFAKGTGRGISGYPSISVHTMDDMQRGRPRPQANARANPPERVEASLMPGIVSSLLPSVHASPHSGAMDVHSMDAAMHLRSMSMDGQPEDDYSPIGEVTKADTLNYRTLKPERDGLFCERIFGPTSDWVCTCGETKERGSSIEAGLRITDHERALRGNLPIRICPICGGEATTSRFRRYRMGYIGLASPVTHIWYLNSRPNLFVILLKMRTKSIKKIAYYKAYSPSLRRPEYLSPCVGPGGYFSQSQWGFLHKWLGGKTSSDDTLAAWNFVQVLVDNGPSDLLTEPLLSLRGTASRVHKIDGSISASPRISGSPVLQRDTSGRLRASVASGMLGKKWTDFRPAHRYPSNTARANPTPLAKQMVNRDLRKKRHSISSRSSSVPKMDMQRRTSGVEMFVSVHKMNMDSVQAASASRLLTPKTQREWIFAIAKPSMSVLRRRWTRGAKYTGSSARAKSTAGVHKMNRRSIPGSPRRSKAKPKIRGSGEAAVLDSKSELDPFTMPEYPAWHENTGGQTLLNKLETKNWVAEILKIEEFLLRPVNLLYKKLPPDLYPILQLKKKLSSDPSSIQTFKKLHPFFKQNKKNQKKRKSYFRQLKLLKNFQKSGFATRQMIISNLPVLPPDLRPIVQLGGGLLASSDVNDLYRNVISRNNRLKYYLYKAHFIEFLIRSEQHLVQTAVDALFENGKTSKVRHTSGQKRLYRSLTDRIGGKEGRFRMNLLGKRVDYSGRSVIVVGPSLEISKCGLPYEMACELFQPFLLRYILETNLCKTIRAAKNILHLNKAFGRQCLHNMLGTHPILLNRAPTLHRLGIQAFYPVLVFGRAIHLHPLVCPAFNADFDGDQMAVHIPLSPAAQAEARLLMLASGNWLSASTGQPNLLPSQDMVLGFYYMTLEKPGFLKGKGQVYKNMADAVQAYQSGDIDLHSQIWLYLDPYTFLSMDTTRVQLTPFSNAYQRKVSPQSAPHNEVPSTKENLRVELPSNLSFSFSKSSSSNTVSDSLISNAPVNPSPQDPAERGTEDAPYVHSMDMDAPASLKSTLRWTRKKAQIQWNADVLSRKNTPRNHNEIARKSKQRLAKLVEKSTQMLSRADKTSYSELPTIHLGAVRSAEKALNKKPYSPSSVSVASSEQPLNIRLHTSGLITKIYASYQWKEDVEKNIKMLCTRTTPGRILLNQIIQKYL